MRLVAKAFVLLLAVGAVACAPNDAANGTGGTAGAGGTGGTAGTGGSPIVFCEPTNDRCSNSTTNPHEPCCEQKVPNQANACDGTESIGNPTTCTATGNTVTHKLTVMEVEDDCNVGYDLDDCDGTSCLLDDRLTNLTPAEGMSGVDNALAGLAPSLEGIGGNLGDLNQALADTLCGVTDDPLAGTCDGGENDGESCTMDEQCPGDGARCNRDDNDCMQEFEAANIRFVVDANPDEDCANVTLLADGDASAHILNLSDDGCASGTLGTIPLLIFGAVGSLANTVVRMTVSNMGFSDGQLGATLDGNAYAYVGEILARGSDYAFVYDINTSTPPTQDTSVECNALSATFVIGGVAE